MTTAPSRRPLPSTSTNAASSAARRLAGLGLCTWALACQAPVDPNADACRAELAVGDLVITEVFPNPVGHDAGKEWFEIYNASTGAVDLAGLELLLAKADHSALKTHRVAADLQLAVGDYGVFGGVLEDPTLRPPYVDYGFAEDLGGLPNSAGLVGLTCGDRIIDQALYEQAADGVARAYDGARTPDAEDNDDLGAWCAATSSFGEALGSPGVANDPCSGPAVPTTCFDGDAKRPVVRPRVGDLIITEILPNPGVSPDKDGEWFEVYVAKSVDLNGLGWAKDTDAPGATVGDLACLPALAGSYLLFARNPDADQNGGLPPVDRLFEFGLPNSAGSLVLTYGNEVLDQVRWSRAKDGVALAVDPDAVDPIANDDLAVFCPAEEVYGLGDRGSPGAPNPTRCPPPAPPGYCYDDGALIGVVAPGPGDLQFGEFMANPEAVADSAGEWIELVARGSFHLNGLELGREPGRALERIEDESCRPVTPGQVVLWARTDDSAKNGGLPRVDGTFDFALANHGGGLFVAHDAQVIDAITWTGTTPGASRQRAPSPFEVDGTSTWCTGARPYGHGDLGTPGEANPECDGAHTCLDDGGSPRPLRPPVVGDLRITEVLADPVQVADARGEWFEVLVATDVDLNGLELGSGGSTVEALPTGAPCLAATAGRRLIFARDADPTQNGGLDPVFATFGFGLANTGGQVVLGHLGVGLDEMSYAGSEPGVALGLDPSAEGPPHEVDETRWCPAASSYGDGDWGTPGAANPACPPKGPGR